MGKVVSGFAGRTFAVGCWVARSESILEEEEDASSVGAWSGERGRGSPGVPLGPGPSPAPAFWASEPRAGSGALSAGRTYSGLGCTTGSRRECVLLC